jgi:hypothetical protein
MHPNITMRTAIQAIPDLPPSSFDFAGTDFQPEALEPDFNFPQPGTKAEVKRQPIKIARATTGTTEIRLLRQTQEGSADTFILENSVLHPYHASRQELTVDEANPKPMDEQAALVAFAQAVAARYPAETLRNGVVVPIHQELL